MVERVSKHFQIAGFGTLLTLAAALTVAFLLFSGVSGAMAPAGRFGAGGLGATPPPPSTLTTKNISVGKSPQGVVTDLANGQVFVANSASNNVTVIKDTSVYKTIKVGKDPTDPIYDPKNTLVYVLNSANDSVSVINGSTDKVVGTIYKAGAYLSRSVYDPANGAIYLLAPPSLKGASNLSRLATKSPWTFTNISVGSYAFYLTYDPATLDLVVENVYVHVGLTIVNSTTNAVKKVSLTTSYVPGPAVYNPKNKDMYILESGSALKQKHGNVTVLDSANAISKTLPVGPYPTSIALNPFNNDTYVVNATLGTAPRMTNGSVTPITSSNTVLTPVKVGQGAFVATYDPKNHAMYIEEEYSNVTAVLSSKNALSTLSTKGSPEAAFYDPASGQMLVILNTATTADGKLLVLSPPLSGAPTLVQTLTLQKDPYGAAYDPTYSRAYASNEGSNSVTTF
jgi:YVTN family beta-propeller protein